MAVTVDELVLKITLSNEKTASELGKINDELKDLQKTAKNTEKGVDGFSASFAKFSVIGFAAIKAVTSIVDSVSSITGSFLEAQDAVTKLNQALEIVGNKTIKASIQRFQDLAESIENFGVASAEQILALARLGTAAGQTVEQTEKLIKAAADLSVARDIPLEQAFKALSSSLKGSSGALANFLPELANLTEEQNKAGFAIDYVSASLGGFASRNLETYSGKVEVLKEKFGDVGEEIGNIVADILDLDESVKKSTTFLGSLQNTLIQNRETFVTLGKVMAFPFVYVAQVIQDLAVSAGGAFGFLKIIIGKFLEGLGLVMKAMSILQRMPDTLGESISNFGKEMAESGKNMATASREMLFAIEPMKEVPKTLEDTSVKANKAAQALADMKKQIMTKDQVAAYDELKKKVLELQGIQSTAALVGADLIRAKAIADKNEIDALAKRIRLTGKLTSEQAKAVETAKTSIDAAAQDQIDKLHLDNLEQIKSKNFEIAQATKSLDATKRQQIAFELENQLRILELERQKIDVSDTASQKALTAQAELLKNQAKLKTEMTDMELPDWIDKLKSSIDAAFGKENVDKFFSAVKEQIEALKKNPITIAISNAVTPTPGGTADGIVSKAGEIISKGADTAVAAAGTIASGISQVGGFIGAMIDVVMNADKYLKVLIDFPKMFLGILLKLPALLQSLIDQFPGMITKIAEALPGVLLKLVDMIPSFIASMLDALPVLIERLAEALPEILIKLISMIPKILVMLGRAMFLAIQALIKGLIRGISNLLKGVKMPRVQIETKGIEKIGQKLAGSASRIFQVKDLTEAAKDPIKKMTEMITDSFKKGTDAIKGAWQWVMDKIIQPIFAGLKAVWMFVWEKIIMPIYEGFKTIFNWINENIFRPIINAFMSAFNWINNNIFKPIIDGLMAVFTWVNENIFKPFVDGIMAVFTWINDNIIQPIATVFMTVFSFIQDNVIKPLESIGQKIAKPITDAFAGIMSIFNSIGDALKSLFKLDFSGLKEAMSEVFSKGGEIVKNAFKGVVNPIIKMFNGLIDLLNALVIPGVSWSVSAGRLGSWSGTLFDDIDLIPGTIGKLQTLAQGGMVQGIGTDTVPAMLTPGEFIVSRPAVQSIGLDNLRAINNGSSPSGSNTYNMSFEINVDAKTPMDEGFIRGTLIPRMSEELKRASLDGKFVLSQKGIR